MQIIPLLPGSSMAMQVNARTHSEAFMATKSFYITPPQAFYMLIKSFHIPPGPSMAMKYFHISGSPPPPPHTHTPRTFYGSFTPPYILSLQCHIMDPPCISLQCHIMDPLTVFGPPHILSLQVGWKDHYSNNIWYYKL